MNEQTQELIMQYLNAFSNFYAIISMKRAWRIIKQQNPDMEVTDDAFCDFVSKITFDDKFYIIVYDEEMYCDEPCKETDPMKKYLITEFLYAADDAAYDEMKDTQEGIRFYVPAKEELLKYADDFYVDRNAYYLNLKSFLQKELLLSDRLSEDIVMELAGEWLATTLEDEDNVDIEYAIVRMRQLSHGRFKKFKNFKTTLKFANLYAELYNNTRMPMYRGNTPKEVDQTVECEVR